MLKLAVVHVAQDMICKKDLLDQQLAFTDLTAFFPSPSAYQTKSLSNCRAPDNYISFQNPISFSYVELVKA